VTTTQSTTTSSTQSQQTDPLTSVLVTINSNPKSSGVVSVQSQPRERSIGQLVPSICSARTQATHVGQVVNKHSADGATAEAKPILSQLRTPQHRTPRTSTCNGT
jgi:hypothetical protein